MPRSRALAHLLVTVASTGALLAQSGMVQLPGQGRSAPEARPDHAFVVDALGQGDFLDLPAAVASAPEGALLLVRAGDYSGVTISGKSLRVQCEAPGAARVHGALLVADVGATQDVLLFGLELRAGLEVSRCAGEVSLTACSSPTNAGPVPPPPWLNFWQYPLCGLGDVQHRVIDSAAVSLVDCAFHGRDGASTACDGSPGEHALSVTDSRVAVYGGVLAGGDGADGPGCHGGYAGSGGDGLQAHGATTRVHVCDAVLVGGEGGVYLNSFGLDGCDGIEARALGGAAVDHCPPAAVGLEIAALARTGDRPAYTITAPPGSDLFLLIAPARDWREFAAAEGVLHVSPGFTIVPLGTMPASGSFTRPFPAPGPEWGRAFANAELQVVARVSGQDRYSEPRSLNVVHPWL